MAKHSAKYAVTFGLAGCYLPNTCDAIEFATRRELVSYIRDEIDRLEWPKSLIRSVPVRRIWSHIARHGSSVAHFSIEHGGEELAFHGLTDDEFAAQQEDY